MRSGERLVNTQPYNPPEQTVNGKYHTLPVDLGEPDGEGSRSLHISFAGLPRSSQSLSQITGGVFALPEERAALQRKQQDVAGDQIGKAFMAARAQHQNDQAARNQAAAAARANAVQGIAHAITAAKAQNGSNSLTAPSPKTPDPFAGLRFDPKTGKFVPR